MILRAWLSILLMGLLSWSVWVGLQNRIPAYEYAPVTFFLHMASPWLLVFISVKSWYRVFIWGRMLKARQAPPILSRGREIQKHPQTNSFILAASSKVLLLFALSGIFNQFSVENIGWCIALIALIIYVSKKALLLGQQS